MNTINEKSLKDYPKPIFINETETILKQMKKSVCQICKKDGSKGTGFFCKIPLDKKKSLSVFITNNHVIDERYLKEENDIIIKMNNGKYKNINTLILKNKFYYTSEKFDITIVEMKGNEDSTYELLELDENILNDTINYIGNSIYILHYPNNLEQEKVAVSYGILKSVFEDNKYSFIHYCSTEFGSSGSPILNLSNNKIIGIHKQRSENKEYNIGSFLYCSLKEFIYKYNNEKNNVKNKNVISLDEANASFLNINPFKILGIKENEFRKMEKKNNERISEDFIIDKYRELKNLDNNNNNNNNKKLLLSYYILFNMNKFNRNGDFFNIKKKIIFIML